MRAVEQPSQQVIPGAGDGVRSYRGVGGWLLFFVLSLTIITPASHVYIIHTELQEYYTSQSPIFSDMLVVDWLMRAVLTVFASYAGIQLWQARPRAPSIARAYLVAVFIHQVVFLIDEVWIVTRVAVNPDDIGSVLVGPIRTLAYIGIWYSYLNKSQRVAATYPTQ